MVIEGTEYNIIRRIGSADKMFNREKLPHLSSLTFEAAHQTLKTIADLYKKDKHCAVDWLSKSSFVVFWTENMIVDVDTERWTYAIEAENFLVEV